MPRGVTALFAAVALCTLFLTSCVDNEPVVDEVRSSVVVDYSSEAASVRLSVFANVKSDLDLASQIRLVNDASGLEWTCRTLSKFEGPQKTEWVGYASFVVPEGEAIPKGQYVLTYEDSCEREGEVAFAVDYPDALLERITPPDEAAPLAKADGAASLAAEDAGDAAEIAPLYKRKGVFKPKAIGEVRSILGDGTKEKVALYSSERELLFFGDEDKASLKDYPNAAWRRVCLCAPHEAVICVFDWESISP